MLKGTIVVEKSFEDKKGMYTKLLNRGDMAEFWKEEGDYIESLVGCIRSFGKTGDQFTITYEVTVKYD